MLSVPSDVAGDIETSVIWKPRLSWWHFSPASGQDGHEVSYLDMTNTRFDSVYDAGGFIAEPRGEFEVFQDCCLVMPLAYAGQ